MRMSRWMCEVNRSGRVEGTEIENRFRRFVRVGTSGNR